MTSKELMEKAKKVKQIEQTIKTLEQMSKLYVKLEKLDYNSRQVINKELFADEMYYDIKDRIEVLKRELERI